MWNNIITFVCHVIIEMSTKSVKNKIIYSRWIAIFVHIRSIVLSNRLRHKFGGRGYLEFIRIAFRSNAQIFFRYEPVSFYVPYHLISESLFFFHFLTYFDLTWLFLFTQTNFFLSSRRWSANTHHRNTFFFSLLITDDNRQWLCPLFQLLQSSSALSTLTRHTTETFDCFRCSLTLP